MISFWNKEMTTNCLCKVEGYDLPPMLGSQIRFVVINNNANILIPGFFL
jgi:hypothetical protein